MVATGAGMRYFLILRWLVLLEDTGPIVLCVLTVIRDAVRVISIYFVLFLAHAIAFWSLYKPFIDEDNPNPNNDKNDDSKVYKLGGD